MNIVCSFCEEPVDLDSDVEHELECSARRPFIRETTPCYGPPHLPRIEPSNSHPFVALLALFTLAYLGWHVVQMHTTPTASEQEGHGVVIADAADSRNDRQPGFSGERGRVLFERHDVARGE